MKFDKGLFRAVEIVAVLMILALLVSTFAGQPFVIGFVETDSMAPTLDPGDGFIAIPDAIAGDISEGDVIVYESEYLHGGGLTTHRVLEETPEGYITQGDANPFLDQDGAEPPVKDEQVVAKALQIGDTVVVIPAIGRLMGIIEWVILAIIIRLGLGTDLVYGPEGVLLAIFLACMVAYGYLLNRDRRRGDTRRTGARQPSRDTGIDPRTLTIVLTAVVVILATGSMLYLGGTHTVTIESAELGQPGIQPGETETETIDVPNSGFLSQHAIFEASEPVSFEPAERTVGPRAIDTVEMTVATPSTFGETDRHVVEEHRYWAVLPLALVSWLHGIHPGAAIAAINLVIAIPFYLVGRALLGTGRLRLERPQRPVDRSPSVRTRLRRTLHRLYEER